MDNLPVCPGVSQVPTSSASSVVLPVSARHGHRRPRTPDTLSTSITDVSKSHQGKDFLELQLLWTKTWV
ncbi:hypothetical protein C1H46_014729 [Malus baccata]|uniref:Uncharacterized protein n=1 Tax=Malus baccata TaxID=106549 RepID=A0A540MLN4_MALBA|nr:hypothetical protein C1H46_014729 [Malus baccata]